jgi:hypothetical protein
MASIAEARIMYRRDAMLARRLLVWIVLCGGVLIALAGCAASMDASKARSRAVIQQGGIVPAEELRVAEYLNY